MTVQRKEPRSARLLYVISGMIISGRIIKERFACIRMNQTPDVPCRYDACIRYTLRHVHAWPFNHMLLPTRHDMHYMHWMNRNRPVLCEVAFKHVSESNSIIWVAFDDWMNDERMNVDNSRCFYFRLTAFEVFVSNDDSTVHTFTSSSCACIYSFQCMHYPDSRTLW